jgi:hypothetical protein
MGIVQNPGSPMMTRGQGDPDVSHVQRFPWTQFVDPIKSQVVHQIPDAVRHDDRLECSNFPQSTSIEMIKMGMRHKYQINGREVVQRESRTPNTLNHFQPERPDRIDQNV